MSMHGVNDAAVESAVRCYVKLLRATKAVAARVEPRLHAEGLTLTQLGVLEAILHRGPMTHRDLGRKVLTSAGNMTDLVDKLEARALVHRVRAADDRRQVRVELTDAGRSMIESVFPLHAGDIAQAMSGISAADMVHLGDMLRALGMAAARGPTADALADDAE